MLGVGHAVLRRPSGKVRNFSHGAFHHGRHAVIACQRLCAAVDGCVHFTMELPSKQCRLMGRRANSSYPVMRSIAGPPSCASWVEDTEDVIVFWRFTIPGGIVRGGGGLFATIAIAFFVVSLACSGSFALRRAMEQPWVASGESDALLLSI